MSYRGYRTAGLGPLGLIITANIIVFLVSLVSPALVYQWFGLVPAGVADRPWTIVTNLFVHASFSHILVNMLTLYFFGSYLSMLLGEQRFLLVYFISGIAGNLTFILIAFYTSLASPFAVVVGASGAIFGVGGTLAILRPNLRVFIFPLPIPIPLWISITIGLFILVSPGIAWQAHLGGLIAGVLIGLYLKRWGRHY